MTDSVQTPAETTDSLAGGLVAAGAEPTPVDVEALLAQMQALQARVDAMSAAQGIPSDPVEAAAQALTQHVRARIAGGSFGVDFTDAANIVNDLDADNLNSGDSGVILLDLTDFRDANPAAEGLPYITQLARNLHREVLKREAASKPTTKPTTK